MHQHITKYNAADLLEELSAKGLAHSSDISDFIISQKQEQTLPIYLLALVGVGAFIASIFFIGFLNVTGLIDDRNEMSFIVWGCIFVAVAVGLQYTTCQNNTIKHSFFMQFSFASMVVGKILFVLGTNAIYDSNWSTTLGLLIITGPTYPIYKLSIDRFLSCLILLLFIFFNVYGAEDANSTKGWLLNGFILFQFVGAGILLTYDKVRRGHAPLAYAFAFSLCMSILFLTAESELSYLKLSYLALQPIFINMLFAAGLIALIVWVAGSTARLKTAPFALALSGVMLLGVISAPGILLAIGLISFSHARHDKLLGVSGAMFLAIFVALYYYNLDISLLQKSGVLVGSGALLLLGRLYLTHKNWNEGGAPYVRQ